MYSYIVYTCSKLQISIHIQKFQIYLNKSYITVFSQEVMYHTPCPSKQLVSPMTTEDGKNPNNREVAEQNSYSTYQKVATVHTCVTQNNLTAPHLYLEIP